MGNLRAILRLAPPWPIPEAVAHLWRWAVELHGRSGGGMGGLMPLSYSELRAWAKLRDIRIRPHEVDALIRIDAVMLHPDPVVEGVST